jgi:transposase
VKFVPAPRLVGIEPNPGPGNVGNRLSEEKRWRIIFMHKDLKKVPATIARELKMNEQTVHNVIGKYEETGTVHNLPKSGRKRKLSEAQVRQAVRKAKKGKTSRQIAQESQIEVDPRTIRRRLREAGLFYGRVLKVEKLTKRHKELRVKYSNDMKDYKWKRVFFSDEKTFQLGVTPNYAWQEHTNRVVKEYVKHAPKLHVWGAIGYYGRTELYCFQENLNSKVYQRILKQNLKESKLIYSSDAPKTLPENWILLQDNASSHKAKKTMEVIQELVGDRFIRHPAKSPDLNIIELIWAILDRKVKAAEITNIQTLRRFLRKEWKALPWRQIRNCVDSMPRRLKLCRESGGNRLPS